MARRTDFRQARSRPRGDRPARTLTRGPGLVAEVHARVARRLLDEGATPVLDVGCGPGELASRLPAGGWVGVEDSLAALASAPQPSFAVDLARLPFPGERFGSVALLFVLGRVASAAAVLAEARRVLQRGGLLAVAAPSGGGQGFDPEVEDALRAAGLAELELNRRSALAFARRP